MDKFSLLFPGFTDRYVTDGRCDTCEDLILWAYEVCMKSKTPFRAKGVDSHYSKIFECIKQTNSGNPVYNIDGWPLAEREAYQHKLKFQI